MKSSAEENGWRLHHPESRGTHLHRWIIHHHPLIVKKKKEPVFHLRMSSMKHKSDKFLSNFNLWIHVLFLMFCVTKQEVCISSFCCLWMTDGGYLEQRPWCNVGVADWTSHVLTQFFIWRSGSQTMVTQTWAFGSRFLKNDSIEWVTSRKTTDSIYCQRYHLNFQAKIRSW